MWSQGQRPGGHPSTEEEALVPSTEYWTPGRKGPVPHPPRLQHPKAKTETPSHSLLWPAGTMGYHVSQLAAVASFIPFPPLFMQERYPTHPKVPESPTAAEGWAEPTCMWQRAGVAKASHVSPLPA